MRVHVIAPGFTPNVFTNNAAPFIRIGVDKLVSFHTSYPNKSVEKRVEDTLAKVEEVYKIKPEQRWLREASFEGQVREIQHFLKGFGDSDEIYLHLEGGQRHVGLAFTFASFFVKKKIRLILALEYGDTSKEYKFEEILPVPAYELSEKQEKILRLVADKENQTLIELSKRVNEKNPNKIAPAVLRQLRFLSELNLVSVAPNGKKQYAITPTGRLFL